MVRGMEAQTAVAQLQEVSKHVESAVIFDADGEPLGATIGADRAARVAERASRILGIVDELEGDPLVTQVEAATAGGSLFVVREGNTAIAATTAPSPVIGLVMYDLRTCLRSLFQEREPV
jgi:predicted regulator of Ras-like GTPase activity (Roadblock/LC7/MglB family)